MYHRTSVHINDSLSFPSSSKDLISKVQQKDSTLNAQPCNALADSNCTHHQRGLKLQLFILYIVQIKLVPSGNLCGQRKNLQSLPFINSLTPSFNTKGDELFYEYDLFLCILDVRVWPLLLKGAHLFSLYEDS